MIVQMRCKLAVIALVWTCSVAAAPDDSPAEKPLLARAVGRMRQVLSQVPNYTCLETIERSVQGRRAKTFSPLDTVLLEISNLGDKELLAWPGGRRLEEADPSSFVNSGLMGNGVFALYARNVFLRDTTGMQYHGDEDLAGRPVERFDYRVPELWSGYQIQANGVSAKVGMTGSFWIDPTFLELVRLEVRADEIPAALGIQRTAAVIDYARMRIGATDVLLPQDATLLLTLLSGEVRRNEIQFSHCREYLTESSIRFDMPDTAPAAPAPAARTVDLPAGLTVEIELESAIDSATAHVGDLLRGHVVTDVRRKGRVIIIPKGAIVTGRIRGLERLSSPERAFDLTIEFAELEWENTSAEFYGELLAKDSGLAGSPFDTSSYGVAKALPAAAIERQARALQTPGTGVLHVTGTRFHIAPGYRMNWRTLEPNRRLKQPE
jgi:hypothetical protein